jgi:nucleoside-diphosphate-sugar epimerase
MRVLVAGGAGFIGSHVCRALLNQGHAVVCVDNLLTGKRANISAIEDTPEFAFVEADVCEPPDVEADLYLHLASPASPVHYQAHPIETLHANSAGTTRLLELAARHHGRFLFASTSEVYGDPLEHPQRETYWGNVNPVGPRACYDEAKRFGEALTMAYRDQRGVNASTVRIFNTYGPRMNADDGRVVPAFIAAALAGEPLTVHGTGNQTRSLCYVDDLVEGLLTVAFDRDAAGEVFNLGNPSELTVLEIAHLVLERTGSRADLRFVPRTTDDPERRRPDISKMRTRYGWAPRVPLTEGLDHMIAYFRRAAEGQTTPHDDERFSAAGNVHHGGNA